MKVNGKENVLIKMPTELKQSLKQEAQSNYLSLTAYIIQLLKNRKAS